MILDSAGYVDLVHKMYNTLPAAVRRRGDHDDLIGAGMLGLVEAAHRYDPTRGPFPAFASRRIRGEMMDYVRRESPYSRGEVTRWKATHNDDEPMPTRIEHYSFHSEVTAATTDPDTDDRMALLEAIDALPPHLADIIILRYFTDERHQAQAGRKQLTESRISQLEAQARRLLRDALQTTAA